MRALVFFFAALLGLAGCSGAPLAKPIPTGSLAKSSACDGDPAPEGRASLALEGSSMRLDLESAMRNGLVAVHRDECGRVRIVHDCRVESSSAYRYESHEPKRSSEEVGRGLHVESVSSGSYRADAASLSEPKLVGAGCSKATHVVTAISVGAFAVTKRSGDSLSISGTGASSSNEGEVVNRDGDAEACKKAGPDPAPQCNAAIDVELMPIKSGPKDAAGASGLGNQGIPTGIIAPQ